jgi:hypothetical protein
MSIKEDLETMCSLSNAKEIFYQTSPYIPKQDGTGQENFSKMKVDNVLEVWLIHPDLLPKFAQAVQNAGKNLVEFDLEQYLNLPKTGKRYQLFFD